MAVTSDTGRPMQRRGVASSVITKIEFESYTRGFSMRNTGTNTLWVSFDNETWFDVACGTSFDDRLNIKELYLCTQTGKTTFVVIGVELSYGIAVSA